MPLESGLAEQSSFSFDPEVAIEHLRSSDPALVRLIDVVGSFDLQVISTSSVFMALAQAIVYQQLHARAASTIFARVLALLPEDHEDAVAAHLLTVPEDQLKGAGLSRNKLLSLRDLAQRTVDGSIPHIVEFHAMDDEAIIERLTRVRGIGRWTAEMFLIFRLGRPDVWPVDDLGIRKGFSVAFGTPDLPSRTELLERGRPWQPYRTVASWYLWRAAELPKA